MSENQWNSSRGRCTPRLLLMKPSNALRYVETCFALASVPPPDGTCARYFDRAILLSLLERRARSMRASGGCRSICEQLQRASGPSISLSRIAESIGAAVDQILECHCSIRLDVMDDLNRHWIL